MIISMFLWIYAFSNKFQDLARRMRHTKKVFEDIVINTPIPLKKRHINHNLTKKNLWLNKSYTHDKVNKNVRIFIKEFSAIIDEKKTTATKSSLQCRIYVARSLFSPRTKTNFIINDMNVIVYLEWTWIVLMHCMFYVHKDIYIAYDRCCFCTRRCKQLIQHVHVQGIIFLPVKHVFFYFKKAWKTRITVFLFHIPNIPIKPRSGSW